MLLSLGVITIVAGALLGGMYAITKEPIEAGESRQLTEAIAKVAPAFDNDPEKQKEVIKIDGTDATVYPAFKDGKLVGAAVSATTMTGFSGEVTTLCGFDEKGDVIDYSVIRHAETPGLGAKMEQWFRDPTAARSVIGKNPSVQNFYVTKDKDQNGQIDAITAATISSRAFLLTLREAYMAYRDYAMKNGLQLAEIK